VHTLPVPRLRSHVRVGVRNDGLAMSVACRLSPQQRKSVCQSATSEARTARIAPPGRLARDTVVGPRPADASRTYNAQTLGQLRADTPGIPSGRSLPRRARPAAQAPAGQCDRNDLTASKEARSTGSPDQLRVLRRRSVCLIEHLQSFRLLPRLPGSARNSKPSSKLRKDHMPGGHRTSTYMTPHTHGSTG
jgi:hypothetical protein